MTEAMHTLAAAWHFISRLAGWLLILPIMLYKKFISPLTPPMCSSQGLINAVLAPGIAVCLLFFSHSLPFPLY